MAKFWLVGLIAVLFLLLIAAPSVSAAWGNNSYVKSYQINYTNNLNTTIINSPVRINISGINCTFADKHDVRVVRDDITEVESQVINDANEVVFLANWTNNTPNALWGYIYCNNSAAPYPSYELGFNFTQSLPTRFTFIPGVNSTIVEFLHGYFIIGQTAGGWNRSGQNAGLGYTSNLLFGNAVASAPVCAMYDVGELYARFDCNSSVQTDYGIRYEFFALNNLYKVSSYKSGSTYIAIESGSAGSTLNEQKHVSYLSSPNTISDGTGSAVTAYSYGGLYEVWSNSQAMGQVDIFNQSLLSGVSLYNQTVFYARSNTGDPLVSYGASNYDNPTGYLNFTLLGGKSGAWWQGYLSHDSTHMINAYNEKIYPPTITLGAQNEVLPTPPENIPPVCILDRRTPSKLNDTSTGTFSVYLNCSDASGINISHNGDHYWAFITRTLDSFQVAAGVPNRWSIRPPNNNISDIDPNLPQFLRIFRAQGRGRGFWYEYLNGSMNNSNLTGWFYADNFSYAAEDGHYGYLNMTYIDATHVIINYTAPSVEMQAFRQNIPISYDSLVSESKKSFRLTDQTGQVVELLVLRNDLEAMKNPVGNNYTITTFINANFTTGAQLAASSLRVFYCNSSYNVSVTNNVLTSPFCTAVTTLSVGQLNVTPVLQDRNSTYFRFSYSIANGTFAGIRATPTFYYYLDTLEDRAQRGYNIRYANNVTIANITFGQTNRTWKCTVNGQTWINTPATLDIIDFTTKKVDDEFQFGYCVYDLTGNLGCNNSVFTDEITPTHHPITSPTIIEYNSSHEPDDTNLNGVHNGTMQILIGCSQDTDNVSSVMHNLTLRYTDGTPAYSISNFTCPGDLPVWVSFNTLLMPDGYYRMNVSATSIDHPSDKQSSMPLSVFIIQNVGYTLPNVTSPITQTYGGRFSINWTAATSILNSPIYRYNVTIRDTSQTPVLVVANNSPTNLGVTMCAKDIQPQSRYCYQETANAQTGNDGSCNLNYSGSYTTINWADPTKTYDGDFSSSSGWASDSNLFINYIKPPFALNNSLWMVKDSINGTRNLSIPAVCWNANITTLKLVATLSGVTGLVMDYGCYDENNTGITIFVSGAFIGINQEFFEEAMYWKVNSFTAHVEAVDNESRLLNGSSSVFGINYFNHTLVPYLHNNSVTDAPTIIIGCNSTFAPGINLSGRLNISRPGDSLYQYNFTAVSGSNTFNLSMPNQGKYNWTCEYLSQDCSEGTNVTTTRIILHDSIPPFVRVDQPLNGELFDTLVPVIIGFNYTVIEDNHDGATQRWCWHILDNSSPQYHFGSTCSNTSALVQLGTHTFGIYANDTLNHVSSSNVTFSVGRTSFGLITPENGLLTNVDNATLVDFQCNVTSFVGNVTWVGLFIINPSSALTGANAFGLNTDELYQLNTTHFMMEEGNYSWYCQANVSGFGTFTSVSNTLVVDRTPPNVTIDQPYELQTFTNPAQVANIPVRFNFTHDITAVSCVKSVVIDGSSDPDIFDCDNETINIAAGGAQVTFSVLVTDSIGNSNTASVDVAMANINTNLTDFAGNPLHIVRNQPFNIKINGLDVGTLITDPLDCTGYAYHTGFIGSLINCDTQLVTPGGSGTLICTPIADMDWQINVTIQCDSTLGYNFSTPFVEIWMDTISPVFAVASFNLSNQSISQRNLTGSWNITDSNLFRINVSVDGTTLPAMDIQDINKTSYAFNISYSSNLFSLGRHMLTIEAWDSHTAELIPDYGVSRPLFSNKITYDTKNGNRIGIAALADENTILNPFTTTKQIDRYTFDYKPSDPAADSYTFEVTTTAPLHIIDKPDSKYKKWLVTGNNWVDFYTESLDADIDIQLVDDYTAEVTITKLVPSITPDEMQPVELGKGEKVGDSGMSDIAADQSAMPDTPLIMFSSIGDLNKATLNYTFYTHNITISYSSVVTELADQQTWVNISHNQTDGSRTTSVSFTYNGTQYSLINNNMTYKANYLADFVTPAVNATTNLLGVWYVNVSGESAVFNFTQQVLHIGLSQCSPASGNVSLTLCGIDEVSLLNVSNMTLNIDFALWQGSQSVTQNMHFGLRNDHCYSFCMSPENTTYQIYSIMEYGDGTEYTDRKYYLYNMTINTNDTKQVQLYHLNTSLASVITYNIVSQQTGLNVPDAYIKLQRYYPDLNQYLTVEIEKTDQNGKAIAKMVLYNVFYKEYVDYPNGMTRLVTAVAKLVSTSRTLAISIGTDLMANFALVSNTRVGVGCDKNIGLCNVSWATLDGSARTLRLELYESTGVSMHLVNSTTSTAASAGQLFIYANPYKNNTNYEARAVIVGSAYPAGSADMNNRINIFNQAGNEGLRLAALVPLILLTIALICALLDFGVVGVVVGSMVGIIIGVATTLIPLGWTSIVSIVLLAGILIYKMVK